MNDSVFSEITLRMIRQYRGEASLRGRMPEPHGTLMEVSIDFGRYTDEYLLGDVMARPGLSMRERSLIIIAALTANRYEIVANGHMRWALNIGITKEEVLDVILQVAHFGNWPVGREIFGLLECAYPGYLRTVIECPLQNVESKQLLSLRERVMVEMGALIARRFSDRLKRHMRYAIKIGVTREEILETIMQVTPFSGWAVGVEAIRVAKEVFSTDPGEKASKRFPSEPQEKGRGIIRELMGSMEGDETFSLIRDVFPDFMNVVTEKHLFGEIWSRPLLSLRERCMITLAILISFRFSHELKSHMRYALNCGLTVEEVLEIIMQSANYTCWGAGVDALQAAKEVFGSGRKGKSPKYSALELQEKGRGVLRQLYGSEDRDELFSLIGKVCPDFLKVITEEHLFGEVWSRPGLSLRDRCMIALAILIARRFGDEIKAHMRYALNVGLSREEILEIILHTANYTCWGAGVDATRTGKDILGAG